MNSEFHPEEFEGGGPSAGELRAQAPYDEAPYDEAPYDEALALSDPASPGELLPEQFDLWLDRLTDGEVPEPQRRALLSRLEQSSGGWRRCALAFLEAQAWREALEPAAIFSEAEFSDADDDSRRTVQPISGSQSTNQPTNHSTSPAGAPARPFASPRLAWQWRPLLGVVAAAASFALAFGLGLLVHKTWLAPRPGATGPVMGVAAQGEPSSGGGFEPLASGSKPPQSGPMKWGAVQFVVDGPEGSLEQVRLPAVDGPDPERWLREQAPAIPDEIVQELRRRGHHVETQRHYLPVPLDDGRSAVFPVDQVEVRFRGGKGYQ